MAGHPTDYTKDTIKVAEEYLVACFDDLGEDGKLAVKVPTIEGLAVHLDVHRDTLYEWEKVHPEFKHFFGKLRAIQADCLINNGLSGAYNPTIAKVLLTKHGYREGIENTGKDGEPLFDAKTKEQSDRAIGQFLAERDTDKGQS